MITNELFQKLLLLNPMAQAIQDARYDAVTTVTLTPSGMWWQLAPLAIVLVVFVGGILYFKKHSASFAEDI
jgi:ABC-type polysaccharide/polyol phosphate export permease